MFELKFSTFKKFSQSCGILIWKNTTFFYKLPSKENVNLKQKKSYLWLDEKYFQVMSVFQSFEGSNPAAAYFLIVVEPSKKGLRFSLCLKNLKLSKI